MGSKSVLVVAAHADDEALGCGGTMARHASEGDVVHAVFLADGVSARERARREEEEKRKEATYNACRILGVDQPVFLGLPDNRLDSLPLLEVVQLLEPIIESCAPQIIYTHHHGDLNVDHRAAHNAVLTACRPLPGTSVRKIYAFEVMSSTEWNTPAAMPFIPNTYVDISPYLDTKMQALEAYALEMRPTPHSRSMEHLRLLTIHRGYSVGMDAAEAFVLIREMR